eukprot:scaffold168859_cov46-Prasinocladus_malaysianus.AAC.2
MTAALSPVIAERAHKMQPQEVVNSLWAFSNLNIDPKQGPESVAVRRLVSEGLSRAHGDSLSPQGLSNLVWSMSVLGILDYDTLRSLAPGLESYAENFTYEAWLQIYMAH